MMISIFRIGIATKFQLATRPNGVEARRSIMSALEEHEVVELDFINAFPSPSFADECVGVLCQTMGTSAFKERVKLTNVSDEVRPLLRHVLSRRTIHMAA